MLILSPKAVFLMFLSHPSGLKVVSYLKGLIQASSRTTSKCSVEFGGIEPEDKNDFSVHKMLMCTYITQRGRSMQNTFAGMFRRS